MKRAKLVEVDYHDFSKKLQRAADAGERITPKEKEAWRRYIREHDVKEAAMRRTGESKLSSVTAVIINNDSDWGGVYIYATDEEVCLKWEVEEV